MKLLIQIGVIGSNGFGCVSRQKPSTHKEDQDAVSLLPASVPSSMIPPAVFAEGHMIWQLLHGVLGLENWPNLKHDDLVCICWVALGDS